MASGKPILSILSDWYFTSKPFELRRNGELYERLGARFYKKYVPTSGDVITRFRKKKRLKIHQAGRRKALEEHEKQTRTWEWRHLVSAIILQAWAIFAGFTIGAEHFWISTMINLVVNIYPIIVQRFNRARIVLCLGRMRADKSL
ncbi:MAG TPA: hypothetical protein PKH39_04890 [Woeseiaceae bacterium]|nr:hypothetical protein [Woeseiaceae bacterium]